MSKIYHNLNKSPYTSETDNNVFVFSSMFYKDKFDKLVVDNREKIRYTLSSRYNVVMLLDDFADFILYFSIEKRGCRVIEKSTKKVLLCRANLNLVGMMQINKN